MACIKSASRSALVAFAPDAPYMAAGTLAGAVDLSFSSTANLEIFKLDFVSDGPELPVVGTSPSSERFNRLSWSKAGSLSEEYSLGLVAGGLGDGSIGIWNPQKLISSEDVDGAYVARLDKHTGPVRGLEFSCLSPNLLASGADEGELCIWNMENPQEPNRFPPLKNPGSGSQGEISYLSWNPKFQHILASTSYSGMTVVWDLKKQKPITSFSDPMKRRCSVLQWNPDISTQLIVASDDDSSPSLKLWDVRKTISPVREFVGHTQGVIAMSWCPTDSSLLLTCSKDFRTVCWDTVKGEIICELPASTNWNFDVHWYPKIPGVISASSFDGKIGLYNIEACSRTIGSEQFSGAEILKAPKWLKRPVGVSFGFGGKIVSFRPSSSTSVASSGSSEVHIDNLVTEHNLVSRSTEFEAAIHSGEKSSLRDLCERKSQELKATDDKEAWAFLKVMFGDEGTARTKLLSHLGFPVSNTEDVKGSDELGMEFSNSLTLEENMQNEAKPVQQSGFDIDTGEDFFNNDQLSVADSLKVSDIQNGVEPELQNTTEEVSDPSLDESIQHALVVGDYKGAVSKCISANRMADALVISHLGGTDLWKATRDQYLKKSSLSYLKVVSALVSNDLIVLVNTRPLSSWKETLALLCTFAQKEEWTMLCDTLASRLAAAGDMLAATLCYICAGNIDKTVEIWSHSLKYETEGRSYTDRLQDLMEKTVVLTLATGQKQFSTAISKLVENYAELLASQGQLTTAIEYLKLLGSVDSSHELAILHNRILQCAQETDIPATKHPEHSTASTDALFSTEQSNLDHSTGSLQYNQQVQQSQQTYLGSSYPSGYQQHQVPGGAGSSYTGFPMQQQQVVPGTSYASGYQQPVGTYGGYQPTPTQPKKQFQDYINPATFQPASSPQMFLPSHDTNPPQMQPAAPPAAPQPAVNTFIPATPHTLKNAEQYQQPSLASQVYPGSVSSGYQPAQPALGSGLTQSATTAPSIKFPSTVTPTATPMGFPQMMNPGFVQNPILGTTQPTNSAEPVQPTSQPATPPPTVQTADTSNVSAELKPVVATLKRLYNETADFLGGLHANIAKRREIEENSRRIGALLAKLNSQDISPNVASKLIQLCSTLDSGDYASALHIQVMLTGSDWDECNLWLAALKRMIKTRQNMRQ